MYKVDKLTMGDVIGMLNSLGKMVEDVKSLLNQFPKLEEVIDKYQPDEMLWKFKNAIDRKDSEEWMNLYIEFNHFANECIPLCHRHFMSDVDMLKELLKSFD